MDVLQLAVPPHIAEFIRALDPTVEDFRRVRIVLLNGPPGAGKDTGAEYLARYFFDTVNIKFSESLKRSVFVDVGIPYETPLDFFDPVKDLPFDLFGGRSFRQALIEKSEDHGKPLYGDAHYGRVFLRRAAQAAHQGIKLLAVSDSGFAGEAKAIIPFFPQHHVMLVRIRAEARGKTFAGDSRGYIDLPEVHQVNLWNDDPEGPASFLSDLAHEVGRYFSELVPVAPMSGSVT